MPWSNQTGGGGWKGGGGPWGQRPPSGGPGGSPDLEELLRRGQDRLRQVMPGGSGGLGGPVFIIGGALVAAVIAFLGFTVRVQPDELGVVLRFGEYTRQLPPGLNFRWPYPIEQVFLPSVTRVNRTEVGMRGAVDDRVVVAAARDVPEESLMLTGDENIVDIDFVVFWRVNDAPDYLFNIQNPAGTVKAVAESAMREVVGQGEIQPILTEKRQETEAAVQDLIQNTLNSYNAGIMVQQVQLQKVDPPQQVIDAFRDVQAARADQERLQNEADTYANRVIPEARGEAERILQAAQAYKQQVIAEAQGQTARFLSIYEEYKKAPDVTRRRMFLETMERVLGGTNKIIVDDKGGTQGVVPYLPLDELTRSKPQGGQQ